MTSDDPKEYFKLYASSKLHKEMLEARAAGRRHGNKLYSCAMAFELGATILLGLEGDEEEVLQRDIDEITLKESEFAQRKRLKNERLKIIQSSKAAKMIEASEQNDNVQKLANRILEIWDNVTLYKKRTLIGSLVDIDNRHLTRAKLEAIFPTTYKNKPTQEDAIKIALDLLGYDGESVGA